MTDGGPDGPLSAFGEAGAPDRATLRAMTGFLTAHLLKTADVGGGSVTALSETAARFNDTRWFWTDDNAKAAELLCEPETYDADPAPAEAALDFVLRMSEGAVIQRRSGPPDLRIVSADPVAVRVETAFFIVEGDLTRGVVRHALRFNDNRTITAARHGGHAVAFRRRGRAVTMRLADTIGACGVEVEAAAAVLWFTGTLACGAEELGRLTMRTRIDRDRAAIALSVQLVPAPGVVLENVVLTTALDGLGEIPRVHYRAVAVRCCGETTIVRPATPGRVVLHRGPADSLAVLQEGGSPGFDYGLHLRLSDGARLGAVSGAARRGGRLQRVEVRYALGTVAGEVTLREERLLTNGGYYDALDHYDAVMRAGGGDTDPSMSYDIGAELNAVAVHLLFARRDRYARPPPPARLDALTAWYDRHVERYFAVVRPGQPGDLGRVFTRGLAFVVLSLDAMLRATGEPRYRAMLEAGVGLILRLARGRWLGSGVTFADVWAPKGCFLDCHAACLLALARAARHGDPGGRLGRAIHAGIADIRLYAGVTKLSRTHREPYEGLAVSQRRLWSTHVDTGFWTYKLGLVLRALHAVRRAAEAGAITMSPAEAERLAARVRCAERQVAACCRRHGDTLEVLTSPIAGETNSETQPWVALGLVPVVDERIEALELAAGPDRAALRV